MVDNSEHSVEEEEAQQIQQGEAKAPRDGVTCSVILDFVGASHFLILQ